MREKQKKYNVNANGAGIGGIGEGWQVEGGLHFHTHTTPQGIPLQRPPRVDFRSLGIGSLTIVDLSLRERIVLYLGLG